MRRKAAVRTLGQQARLWSVRLLLDLVVLALLGAAFYGIYWATRATVTLQVWRALGEERPWNLPFQGWRRLEPGILGISERKDWGLCVCVVEVARIGPWTFRVLEEEEAGEDGGKHGPCRTAEPLLLVHPPS